MQISSSVTPCSLTPFLGTPDRSGANSLQENISHLARQFGGARIDPRVVPGVDPVHHPEQAKHRGPAGEFQPLAALIVVQQLNADAVILALDGCDLAAESVLQHLIFMGENLHRFLIGEKVLQMVEDEHTNSLGRMLDFVQPRAEPRHDGGEGVLLDQVQQFLFGFEIVVQAGERYSAGARQIAHRCSGVAFFIEDVGGVDQYLGQAPVKTSLQTRSRTAARKLRLDWRSRGHCSNVRSNNTTTWPRCQLRTANNNLTTGLSQTNGQHRCLCKCGYLVNAKSLIPDIPQQPLHFGLQIRRQRQERQARRTPVVAVQIHRVLQARNAEFPRHPQGSLRNSLLL